MGSTEPPASSDYAINYGDNDMRKLMIQKITEMLLESTYYADYIHGYGDYARTRHAEIIASLDRANDAILLSFYARLLQGIDVIPCSVDKDGNYADVHINHGYGGMIADGSIHT